MRKIKYIGSLFLFIIFVISIKITGCEQEDLDFYVNCNDCLAEPPDSSYLIVYLTIDDENPSVPLVFYRGDIEENNVDWEESTNNDTLYLYSEVGTYYSVKATYMQDGEPIIAVDGDKLKVVDGEGECYPPCYVIRGGTLDLRLK